MLRKHSPGKGPLDTSLDLYQELRAVTPDSLRYLLHDLFKENTFWDLEAKQATVKQIKAETPKKQAGLWQVTFKVQTRKTVVSEMGLEKEVPLRDWIEVGIFGPAKKGEEIGKAIYLRKHLIGSNQQTITVLVQVKPSHVGIDPNCLLIDWDMKDNLVEVKK